MNLLALLTFVAAAAPVLFALFQWLRDRWRREAPRLEWSPSPRQFGMAYTSDTRVGHAEQHDKEEFRPLADMPASPPDDGAPPLRAIPPLIGDGHKT